MHLVIAVFGVLVVVVTDTPYSVCPPPDVPEPPVGRPHVYDVSRRSVSLSWCGPAYDGGSAVTHYAIEVRDSGTERWTTLVPECQVKRPCALMDGCADGSID